MEKCYEVQANVEIWRTPYCTFTVMYVTTQTVVIKGLRGAFSRDDYRALNNIFHDRGFTTIIFERDKLGQLVQRTKQIKQLFKGIFAYTTKR